MNDYMDIYLKRVNRYGEDYQTRTQGRREEDFEYLLKKSIYQIDFEYNKEEHSGVFTPYSQNETKTLHYLLTRRELEIPAGTILDLPVKIDIKNNQFEYQKWLVYYKEEILASGYNKYIMLRMSHEIVWIGRDGNEHRTWAYLYGQESGNLKDDIKSTKIGSVYVENQKASFFVTSVNEHINKDDYFVLRRGTPLEKGYRVTGYDFDSTLGVEYVTVDPVYLRDETPAPADDGSDDFYWLRGGEVNGGS